MFSWSLGHSPPVFRIARHVVLLDERTEVVEAELEIDTLARLADCFILTVGNELPRESAIGVFGRDPEVDRARCRQRTQPLEQLAGTLADCCGGAAGG